LLIKAFLKTKTYVHRKGPKGAKKDDLTTEALRAQRIDIFPLAGDAANGKQLVASRI
jgi:hypothetical protein